MVKCNQLTSPHFKGLKYAVVTDGATVDLSIGGKVYDTRCMQPVHRQRPVLGWMSAVVNPSARWFRVSLLIELIKFICKSVHLKTY